MSSYDSSLKMMRPTPTLWLQNLPLIA